MAKTIGRNTNVNDTATLSNAIVLNITTSTKLADANPARIMLIVSNASNKEVWLKLQATSVDNDKKGIFIDKGGMWTMPTDNVYTGEICAIADIDAPVVYVTEY